MPRSPGRPSSGAASPAAPAGGLRPGKRGPGRPPIHQEDWTKVTVVLFDRQVQFLDRIAASVRSSTGVVASRAQLIRALVDAAAEAQVDFSASHSEADMKKAVLARLGSAAAMPSQAARQRRRPRNG